MSLNKLSCPFPSNINPLSSGGFVLSIDKAPNIKFWCNQASLPGLNLGASVVATPFATAVQPGDGLTYDPLSVTFMIDANMDNYYELWGWINNLGFPESWGDFQSLQKNSVIPSNNTFPSTVSDGTLSILDNNNKVVRNIQFIDLWPTSLNSLQLQANNSDVMYLAGEVTFNYTYWKFI